MIHNSADAEDITDPHVFIRHAISREVLAELPGGCEIRPSEFVRPIFVVLD